MVHKGGVLLRVEYLQQSRGGVAAEVVAEFVDFVQQEDRVDGAGLAQRLDDLARQGADIGLAVPADFRLVADPTQGYPDELAVDRPGHRTAQAGLSGTRGSDETENRSFGFFLQLTDCQKIQHPLFRFGHVVVVFIQNLFGPVDIPVVFALIAPGQVGQPLQIGAQHSRFGRHRLQPGKPLGFLLGFIENLLRRVFGLNLFNQLFGTAGVFFVPAELLVYLADLFVEVVLLLVLLHLFLYLAVDLILKRNNFVFGLEMDSQGF